MYVLQYPDSQFAKDCYAHLRRLGFRYKVVFNKTDVRWLICFEQFVLKQGLPPEQDDGESSLSFSGVSLILQPRDKRQYP
jgi:hypothetical protein